MDERSTPTLDGDPTQALGRRVVGSEAAELEALEGRVREAQARSDPDAPAEARRLVRLEHDVAALAYDLQDRDPGIADDRGQPLVADLARWRTLCGRIDVPAATARADALVEAFLQDGAAAWRTRAATTSASRDAGALFQVLAEATDLDLEAIRRTGSGDAVHLEADRDVLRGAFASLLEGEPADTRQREAWTTALLDRADVVLTAIDDLSPDAARAQLACVASDLAWHLRHVETTRGIERSRLRRKLRRLRAEGQERELQGRLEGIFGPAAVGRFERLILGLIFLVLGLLLAEAVWKPPPHVLQWMILADTAACLVFLWDFFFKLAIVRAPRWRWFARHALVDLLPSLPIGVLTLGQLGPDSLRAGRAIRLLRLTRVARYVRVLMPVIRTVRAFGFLTRGVDRMVRRYGHLLNRDIILYPTRAERLRARDAERGVAQRLGRVEAGVTDLWEDLLVSADVDDRAQLAVARIEGLEAARREGYGRPPDGVRTPVTRAKEITAEALVRRLEGATPEALVADQGSDFVSRIARAARVFARPPLRWVPFLGRYGPSLGPGMSDGEVAAASAHHLARRIRGNLDRWFFFGDLYGTITPAEFVDRVGATLVKGAFRPAYRLILFGAGLVIVEILLSIAPSDVLSTLSSWLGRLVNPILILGALAVGILALGWWLQRVAGEATSFLEQTAAAQFLPLMESVKGRFLHRDGAVLARRVLGPEKLVAGAEPAAEESGLRGRFTRQVTAWLLEAQPSGDVRGSFDALERAVLLYRDGMDGALLDASDMRTTSQLLGNPALRTFLRKANCVSPRERKALQALDLASQRRAFGGPYLWFSLITRAVMHAVARLIVEYNRHAIPLAEIDAASAAARASRDAWIGNANDGLSQEEARRAADEHVTTAFAALHFLDDDARRDHEVTERFGPEVLRRLQRDRRALFRRIFGTYPLHTRPHEQRVVNLYRFYEDWLEGGKALLLPLRGLWGAVKWVGRIVSWVVDAVREIKNPRLREEQTQEAEADFTTAVRKIDRMRRPLVEASLRLRARVDCEYLGVRLPGFYRTGIEAYDARRDLEFLHAPPDLIRRIEEERDRAHADVRSLAQRIDDGLLRRVAARLGTSADALGREHVRALAFAWRADLNGVRSLLAADEVLRETALQAAQAPAVDVRSLPSVPAWLAFRRWWKAHGEGGWAMRRAAWRQVRADVNGARRALGVLRQSTPEEARAEGELRIAELLRHPARLSEQLVTLRIVQVLGLIDVLNYRTHVWRLGRYEEDGDEAERLLCLDPDAVEASATNLRG